MSETQDPVPLPRWRTGDVDLTALTAPPVPAEVALTAGTFESTVPGARPASNLQTWVDVIIAVTGISATVIFFPIWITTVVGGIAGDRLFGDQVGFAVAIVALLDVMLWVFVAGAVWGIARLRSARAGRPLIWWRLDAFARANGLSYRPWAQAATITTSLVRGRTRFWLEDRLQPQDDPGELTVATLVVEGDSGNFSVGTRRWGFVELRLDRSLPHLVVETTERTRAESDFGLLPAQSWELEGDFPRFARVYADDEDRRTALELLTPDVMAAIVDETAGYDLEVRGDRLSIVSPDRTDLSDPVTLGRMFRMAAALGVEARRVSTAYGDGRYVVGSADDGTPGRMTQRRVGRGAIRAFVISAVAIVVPSAAAIVVPLLRGL